MFMLKATKWTLFLSCLEFDFYVLGTNDRSDLRLTKEEKVRFFLS